jgi:hypothetical protein
MEIAAGFDFIFAALLSVALVNALLGLIVARASRREENRVFSLVAFSVALWTLANALFRRAATIEDATLWAQVAYIAALATAATFLHFAWVYPQRAHSHPRAALADKAALYAVGTVVAVYAAVPGLVIRGIDLPAGRILTGPGLWMVALFMLVTSTIAFWRLLHSQNRLDGRQRAQARYVLLGSALTAVLGLFFNLFLPLLGNYQFVWLGPLCSLFFVGFSAYSIVAHHLFDVRLLIRRTLVYTLLLSALAGAFTALEKGLEHWLLPFLGHEGGFATDLVAALVVGFAVDPLKRALHHFVASKLFQNEGQIQLGDEREVG